MIQGKKILEKIFEAVIRIGLYSLCLKYDVCYIKFALRRKRLSAQPMEVL